MMNEIKEIVLSYVDVDDPFQLSVAGTATVTIDQVGVGRLWARMPQTPDGWLCVAVEAGATKVTLNAVAGPVQPLMRLRPDTWALAEPVEVPEMGKCRIVLIDVPLIPAWIVADAAE